MKGLEKRKIKAQFFTPAEVSQFMADMFTIEKEQLRLLDAGAGVGNLSAAFCQRLIKSTTKHSLIIDAYESDSELIPALKNNLDVCITDLNKVGHKAKYNINTNDFVLDNEKYLDNRLEAYGQDDSFYDYIISNPPYYKLDKESPQAQIMKQYTSGHPNIYALFMILSARMLKKNGELVFITPRSFCSGMYFNKFRKLFLQTARIDHIHLFESRKDIFGIDSVLQENILIKATRTSPEQENIKISFSKNKQFKEYNEIEAGRNEVIFKKNGDIFIRIPSSNRDLLTVRAIDTLPNTLRTLGLEVSTGPVVHFRTEETVQSLQTTTQHALVPLLWAHNFNGMLIDWSKDKKKKHNCIKVNDVSKPILVPTKNYVLLKRFSSKEQKKRLHAAVLLKDTFPFDFVGLENHLNYIHKVNGEMSKEEAFGIASILNCSLVDNYFRSLNGNTQVNALEIRSLPLPTMEKIVEIGRNILMAQISDTELVDKIVFSVLEVDNKLISLYKKAENNGQA